MGKAVFNSAEEMGVELGPEGDRNGNDGSSSSAEVVQWDNFLPRMMLRVLLVEADDSTRQIIAALLRKCSYKVAAVPDGLKAWETLKGKPHNIDLILTEVELPSISGYALLTLVMEHDVCKNIPVIMMSSHDSISMVFKCMLKGAADFLIKPVRRNELKNLWQHVWRRQNLNAGQAPQKFNDLQRKTEAVSDKNEASNHSSGCVASVEKDRECSEKVSDAHGLSQIKYKCASNLSKQQEFVELDRSEKVAGEKLNRPGSEVLQYYKTCNSSDLRLPEKRSSATMMDRGAAGAKCYKVNANISVSHECNEELAESSNGVIDFISSFDTHPKCAHGHVSIGNDTKRSDFAPQLELSLKRLCPSSSPNEGTEEWQTLNHSDASAFSQCSTGKVLPPLSPISSDCTELKEEKSKLDQLLSNGLSDNTVGCAATMNKCQETMSDQFIGKPGQSELAFPSCESGAVHMTNMRWNHLVPGCGHLFPPMYCVEAGLCPAWNLKDAGQKQFPFAMDVSLPYGPNDIHSSDEGCHRSDQIKSVDKILYEQDSLKHAEEGRHFSPSDGQFAGGSSCNGVVDHNNCSRNESTCSKSDENTPFDGVAAQVTTTENLKNGGSIHNDGFRGVDSHQSSQREAALMKFRLKRKDRCFEKKVRYQSRQRLAVQRPRVRGQFVRQVQTGSPVTTGDGCP